MTIYYRTGAGDHRHASRHCAFAHKRSVLVAEVAEIAEADAAQLPPCIHCCTATEIAAHAATPAPQVDETVCTYRGAVRGSYNPSRVQLRGTCAGCGATGVPMVRSSMTLRKHARG